MSLVQYTLTFGVPVKDLSYGYNGITMSTAEFKDEFLWGIPLCNIVTGQALPDYVIAQKIKSAQKYIESMLDLKIFKQYVEEQKNFVRDEYMTWVYIKASWMVNTPFYVTGRVNTNNVLIYPNEWVTVRRKLIKDDSFSHNIYLVPTGQGSMVSFNFQLTINNLYAFFGSRVIPEYWFLQYLTGFEIIPYDVINLIGKQAALDLLPIIEMTVAGGGNGFTFGSASNSLGLDGMSQSISKANGGNIFRHRIMQYQQEIKDQLVQLKMAYTGIVFDVV